MDERCKNCIHFYEEQVEYAYCHECAMNADYFKPIGDASSSQSR